MVKHTQQNVEKKSCGLFGRDDVIRHVNTPLINWHGPTGTVFSVDIQPMENDRKRRIATGGSDSNVQVWELVKDEEGVGGVEHLAQLSRHDCAVNVVRFHPNNNVLASASDDRCLFIWKLDTTNMDGAPEIFSEEDEGVKNAENWTVIKQIRGHSSEVYDLAWSPDAAFILSGTMDNTAYVWNTATCKKRALLQHHKGYVQGVAWDPGNKFITTVSSDRSAIAYNTSKFESVQRISKMKSAQRSTPRTPTPCKVKESINNSGEGLSVSADEPGCSRPSKDLKIFLDTGMVETFFRRPGFSPDGKLVAYPCGCYEVEMEDTPADTGEDSMVQINVVYLFQLKNLETPVLCLPTGKSPAIAVRFCPRFFTLRPKTTSQPKVFNLPYRMVYAVVTLDNVLLYDTQQEAPFASISSIHYEPLTDASWASDGSHLIVSSIDGFCTIITLDTKKLGTEYQAEDSTTKSSHLSASVSASTSVSATPSPTPCSLPATC
ncbi:chromatin assembly factor 1 subunit B-like [Watersipora subatra]|uniref:chromatin assembly factor 1 subunit B-like n=1 Tax=Watersipora subatra TaxID=2589382 RepID=UPI00355B3FE0